MLGLQWVATAVLQNIQFLRGKCCVRNAFVFLLLENFVVVSVTCGTD